MQRNRHHLTLPKVATIANGASLSDDIDCGEFRFPVALWIPAWTAAALSFQSSPDGVIWGEVGDKAGLYSVASAAIDTTGAYIVLDPLAFGGVRYLKIRSGTKAAAVAQGAQRLITIFVEN